MRLIATHGGTEMPVEVERHAGGYRVKLGERWMFADLVNAGGFVRSLRLEDGTQFALMHHCDGETHEVTVAGSMYRIDLRDPLSLVRRKREDSLGGHGVIKALMPGRIVRVLAAKGDVVGKGAGILVLEAMKMENEIQAPVDGMIEELFVEAGQTVEAGAELVRLSAAAG